MSGKYKVLRSFLILLIIAVSILQFLFSLWLIRKSYWRTKLLNIRIKPLKQASVPGDRYYLEGVDYLVGDITCQFNARSAYIRCAVNPSGPCQGCRHFQSKTS